jgi:glutamate dehydrogenase/leucine dehydrogenase
MQEYAADKGYPFEGASVAIQGFGNVGSWAARIAGAGGAKVVAVSDVRGGIHAPGGLDIEKLWMHVGEHRSVVGFPGTDEISNEELLELDVDWLVPAALGEVINGRNASKVKAKVIVEAANHPITPLADAALADAGAVVIPDILANAGGVTVSYFEWTQNIQQFRWDEDEVNARLRKIMAKGYRDVAALAAADGVGLREAAFSIGVKRVARAARLRGYV